VVEFCAFGRLSHSRLWRSAISCDNIELERLQPISGFCSVAGDCPMKSATVVAYGSPIDPEFNGQVGGRAPDQRFRVSLEAKFVTNTVRPPSVARLSRGNPPADVSRRQGAAG
jgi:hypothetical protein